MTDVMISTTISSSSSDMSESACQSQDPVHEDLHNGLPKNGDIEGPPPHNNNKNDDDDGAPRSAPMEQSETENPSTTTIPIENGTNHTSEKPESDVSVNGTECLTVDVMRPHTLGNFGKQALPQQSNGIKRTLEDCLNGGDDDENDSDLVKLDPLAKELTPDELGGKLLKRRRTATGTESHRIPEVLQNGTHHRPLTPQFCITTTKTVIPISTKEEESTAVEADAAIVLDEETSLEVENGLNEEIKDDKKDTDFEIQDKIVEDICEEKDIDFAEGPKNVQEPKEVLDQDTIMIEDSPTLIKKSEEIKDAPADKPSLENEDETPAPTEPESEERVSAVESDKPVEEETQIADKVIPSESTDDGNTVETPVADGAENHEADLNLIIDEETEEQLLAEVDESEQNEKKVVHSTEPSESKSDEDGTGEKEDPVLDTAEDSSLKSPESHNMGELDDLLDEDLENQDSTLVLHISSESEGEDEDEVPRKKIRSDEPVKVAETTDVISEDVEVIPILLDKPSEDIAPADKDGDTNEPEGSDKEKPTKDITPSEEVEKETISENVYEVSEVLPPATPVSEDVLVGDTVTTEAQTETPPEDIEAPSNVKSATGDVNNVETTEMEVNSETPVEETEVVKSAEQPVEAIANEIPTELPAVTDDNSSDVEMMDLGEPMETRSFSKTPSPIPAPKTRSTSRSKTTTPVSETPEPSTSVTLQALTKFKGSFKDITREDLEALIMEKMIEAILFKSKAAENAQKIKTQEAQIAKMQSKLEEVKRQFRSVDALFKSASEEVRIHEKKNGCKILPKPILRTVGIQSQSVHYLRCKTCGTKTTTVTSIKAAEEAALAAAASGNTTTGSGEPGFPAPIQTHNRMSTASPSVDPLAPAQKTKPTAKPTDHGTRVQVAPAQQMFVDLTEDDDAPPSTAAPKATSTKPAATAKPMVSPKPTVAPHPVVTTKSAAPKTAPVLPKPDATNGQPKAANVHQKPANVVQQRSMSMGGAVPPLVTISKPAMTSPQPQVHNHPPLRASQPAPIPTQTVKRASLENGVKRAPAHVVQLKHPAPLPSFLMNAPPGPTLGKSGKLPPPVPKVGVRRTNVGIILTWTMDTFVPQRHAEVKDYQLYGYQSSGETPSTQNWKSLGHVKALKLPMAVTLTQFQQDHRYFFCVRARDAYSRYGSFSVPATW